MKKRELDEIIDGDDALIGSNAVPKNGSDLHSVTTNTSDSNATVGHQPFRYDMLGRFGFTLMPFFENDDSKEPNQLTNDLNDILNKVQFDVIKYYFKNPNKLKSDYRKMSSGEDVNKVTSNYSGEILKLIGKYFEDNIPNPEKIDEENVIEDYVLEKKDDNEFSKKSENDELKDKKLKKIAGLIGRLDKKDINNLINLLEING